MTPTDPPSNMDALLDVIDTLVEGHQELSEKVKALEGTTTKPEVGPEEFSAWVAWLSEQYHIPELPRQVERSSAIALEIKALHAAHLALETSTNAWDAITWHDALARVTSRLSQHEKAYREAEQGRGPRL